MSSETGSMASQAKSIVTNPSFLAGAVLGGIAAALTPKISKFLINLMFNFLIILVDFLDDKINGNDDEPKQKSFSQGRGKRSIESQVERVNKEISDLQDEKIVELVHMLPEELQNGLKDKTPA